GGWQLPVARAADLDRDDVEAGGMERGDRRGGGGEGDVVFRRAAPGQDRHANTALGHGLSRPTMIVTFDPFGALLPAGGSVDWTIPSWVGAVTGTSCDTTLKPWSWSCFVASAAVGAG